MNNEENFDIWYENKKSMKLIEDKKKIRGLI